MAKKQSQNNKLKNNQDVKVGASDLLAPILFVICIMPFIVRMAEYSTGYGDLYNWAAEGAVMQNLYSYYRAYAFEFVIALAVVVLAFRLFLYKEYTKPLKVFLPAVGYVVFVVLATIFSINVSSSLAGNNDSFENLFVLVGYVIIGFYTYQILQRERDFRILYVGFLVLSVGMIVIGLFQIAGHDLLNFEAIQKLVMNEEQENMYLGGYEVIFSRNYVFLSLYNPNFAGQFLAMLTVFLGILLAFQVGNLLQGSRKYTDKKAGLRNNWEMLKTSEKVYLILTTVILVFLLVLLFNCYSRGALLSLAAGLFCFAFLFARFGRLTKKHIAMGVGVATLVVLLFFIVDGINGFYFTGRLLHADKQVQEMAVSQDTYADGILVTYADGSEELWESTDGETITGILKGSDRKWKFVHDDETGLWLFTNRAGKYDILEPIEVVDFGNLKYLGSGRLYIWSRVLPLLKYYWFCGSGPDTFTEVFPQNDYLGKFYYCRSTDTLIESAHNMYLNHCVQTGVPSVLCLIALWGYGIYTAFRRLQNYYMDDLKKGEFQASQRPASLGKQMALAAGCSCIAYLVGGLVNASTLYTTPLFWVFFGIMLAGAYTDVE